jgi:Domain of unknown function (DU1801)
MKAIDDFYAQQEEPIRGCLLALKAMILAQDNRITPAWKYGMPFFTIHNKMFCYLWVHKKYKQPYIGIVEGKKIEHPQLLIEKRSRMKILLVDAKEDLPLATIQLILQQTLALYKQ